MEKWMGQHTFLITLIAAVLSVTVYVFTTFATVDYVDGRHAEVSRILDRMDSKLDKIQDKLSDRRNK